MKNRNYKDIISTIILTAFIATFAFAQTTYTDKKEKADLSEYQTYEWVFNKEIIPNDQVFVDGNLMLVYNNMSSNKHVKDAINAQMLANGFSHDPKNPDMLVNFHIFEKPAELRTFRLNNRQDYLGFGPRSMTTKMVPVEAGTILVNFIDAETGVHVWQGFASGAFDVADLKDISNLEAKVISIFNDWNFDPFGE